MKIKIVLISLVVTVAMVGGIGYGAYYSLQGQKKPVEVVPVANVNYGYWGSTDTMSGTVISMDSQTVQLNSEYELTKVYVETGDEVKIGDPLLEYDMTLAELKAEMESLTKQTLELNLQSMQKALEKLQKITPTASVSTNNDSVLTSSGDGELLLEDPEASSSPEGSGTQESAGESSQAGGNNGDFGSGNNGDPGSINSENPGGGSSETDIPGGDSLIEDEEEQSGDGSEEEGSFNGDLIIDNDDTDDGMEETIDAEAVISQINAFLTRVNQISSQELTSLIGSDIDEALRIFRNELANVSEEEITDVLGERRTRRIYSLQPAIASLVGESTAEVLSLAYDRACVYRFIYCMQQLTSQETSLDDMDDLTLRSMEEQIRTAVEAYYGIQSGAWENEDYQEALTSYSEQLGAFVARLNYIDTMEETEPQTEPVTEGGDDFGDFGGGFGDFGGDGESYTAEELKQAIADQQRDIDECQLQIRESELKLKQYERTLSNKVVKSTMNGVVKSAGTVEDAVADDSFIVIAGASGMYVRGTISETKLDTVEIGDRVQGVSYDTGLSFEATITEISQYPSDNNESYYYGSGNSNASYYPFLAYIEDADGLMADSYVELQLIDDTPTTGIYLEKYFIRTESNGKSYVYIQGSDGLLKKQYVKTGASLYGIALEIREGLSLDDKLAFPYGDDVVEGAETKEVDSLESAYGYY